jgi:ubiquinone/menaquinone biosynthesis C-methylase UbiE
LTPEAIYNYKRGLNYLTDFDYYLQYLTFFLRHHRDVIRQFLRLRFVSEGNQTIFESRDEVNRFINMEYLRKPEVTILDELREKLRDMKMLDIGVGGGRTTGYFACLTKEYVGIDYSPTMIEAAQKKFKNYPKKISLLTMDARNMTFFPDGYFDFVLFSYCGIDYVSHEDRLKILREIRRILRKGGFFSFSTHNLNYFKRGYSVRLSNHRLRDIPWRLSFLLTNRLLNKDAWMILRDSSKNPQHLIINEPEPPRYTLKTYTITPLEQFKQLDASDFESIRVYSKEDGKEIKNPSNAKSIYLFVLSQAR